MKVPLQITFRQMKRSEALVERIKERVAHLEHFCNSIIGCRVVVEFLNRRHQQGNLFQCHIELKVPRTKIISGRDAGLNGAHEDPYVVIRDAFDACERQLEAYMDDRRTRVHLYRRETEAAQHARVSRILRGDGEYGFLITPEGREIYFHKNSVLNKHFDHLKVGTAVRFVEELGENGPQASTVDVVSLDRSSAA